MQEKFHKIDMLMMSPNMELKYKCRYMYIDVIYIYSPMMTSHIT